MAVAWPYMPDLPNHPNFEGSSGEGKDLVERTKMSVGPAKVRQRVSDNVEPWKLRITVNATQLENWKTFFHTSCAGGATEFTWYHPENTAHVGAVVTMAFVGTYRVIPAGRAGIWRVFFNVEILP